MPRWLLWTIVLMVPIYIMAWIVASKAAERMIPQPCVELANQRGAPLPTNEKEARRARWNVNMLALLGDQQARACRNAIKAELRK